MARRPVQGESIACAWLRLHGYRVLCRNWRIRGGEIDIVARRGRTLLMVEVKARAGGDVDAALPHPGQLARLARAARAYRQANPEIASLDLRLDVLVVRGRGLWRGIMWFKGIDPCHASGPSTSDWGG